MLPDSTRVAGTRGVVGVGWTSVTEALPSPEPNTSLSRSVLIFTPGLGPRLKSETVQVARRNTASVVEQWVLPNGTWPGKESVTHWMYVPALPCCTGSD
ncbi:MAG: hypothetical protein V4671_08130 [Armatimonadota bacterium]